MEDELLKIQQETIARRADQLSESNYNLHNAILTINGIFISFFSIASVVNAKITRLDTFIFGLSTCIPIVFILLHYIAIKALHVSIFNYTGERIKSPEYHESLKGKSKKKKTEKFLDYWPPFFQSH